MGLREMQGAGEGWADTEALRQAEVALAAARAAQLQAREALAAATDERERLRLLVAAGEREVQVLGRVIELLAVQAKTGRG